jgi:TatD DNase family protein
MLTDTHAHLDFPDFANDLTGVLGRAHEAGVKRVITISTSVEGTHRAIRLASEYPAIWATAGVHPSNAMETPDDFVALLRSAVIDAGREDTTPRVPSESDGALRHSSRVVAIGECGLDYHRLPSRTMHEAAVATVALGNETPADVDAAIADGAVKSRQADVFQGQLELAAELNLPVVIHERDAWDDTISILRPFTGKVRAVFHCFGKSREHADEVLAMGHLVSFTGIVTFKNAQVVQETVASLPVGSFMVETDCPYLAPVPHRGKRCEPAHVQHVAAHIAMLRSVTLETIAAETEATANSFFRFGS